MILAIDVGNTNIVLGCIEDGNILNIVRLRTDIQETEAEYAIKLAQLLSFENIKPKDLDGAIISSVVPPVTGTLSKAVRIVTGCTPLIVGPGMKTGINVRVDDPGTVAGDLIVGSVAAVEYYGAPAIILDLGTATTITVVDKSRSFVGGAILPGVKLGLSALSAGTSLLPDISISAPAKAISTNTVDCMRSGAIFGTAATIDGMIERYEAELGYECKIVATGGIASSVTKHCKRDIICDNDLLLKGLWTLYQKNTK